KKLGELIVTPTAGNLRHLFFLTESAKGLGKSAAPKIENSSMVVVGTGVMGGPIAGQGVRAGIRTNLQDVKQEMLDKALADIKGGIEGSKSMNDEQKKEKLALIEGTCGKDAAWAPQAKLVLEAVPEILPLKQKVLGAWAAKVAPDAILATNTSSIP